MATITLNVTTIDDQNDGFEGDGLSLREAILTANRDTRNQYIINVPAGEYKLDLKNTLDAPIVDVTSIDLPTLIQQRNTTGDLDVSSNVTIIGADPDNTIIDADDLKTTFEARLAELPIAPLEGGEEDPIPGPESQLISVTIDGVPVGSSPIPIGATSEFNTSQYTISDRIFDVEDGATLNLQNVTAKNGLLVTTKEVILDLVDTDDLGDDDPSNDKLGEIYTRTYSIVIGFDAEGAPIEAEVVERYRLKDVITQFDIEAGGTISTGNVDTTPEGAGIKIGVGSRVNLENVILEGNGTESLGGAIYNNGTLNIDQSTIQDNSAFSAGAIQNNNVLIVNRSTIQENASGLGTGIHNFSRAEVYNSLIANNSAGSNFLRTALGIERFVFPIGAGIFNESSGNLVVVNSTIYGNEGGVDLGGGILSEGRANIVNSTIIENTGQGGAGIWANTPTANVTLYNSIVAQNKKPNFNYYGDLLGIFYNVPDAEGFIKGSNNYLGYGNGVLVDGVNGNIARTNIGGTQPVNIGLGSLQDNGGITRTVAISGDSDFVDAGTNTIDGVPLNEITNFFPSFNLINGQPTDQRITETIDGVNIIRTGFQRIANGTVDIGAFEFNAQEITVTIEPEDPDNPDEPGGGGGGDGGGTGGGGSATPDRDNHGDTNSVNNTSQDITTQDTTNQDTTNTNQTINIQDAGSISNDNAQLDDIFDMALFRWQNTDRPGTYLYANGEESINIDAEYPNFNNEGFAFSVGSSEIDDDLIAFYRFHNTAVPGTYLYANETERISILENYQNFDEEGLAFYAYDGNANLAEDVYRLQNLDQLGTYLFVNEQEKDSILSNPNYNYALEGIAFEASFTL